MPLSDETFMKTALSDDNGSPHPCYTTNMQKDVIPRLYQRFNCIATNRQTFEFRITFTVSGQRPMITFECWLILSNKENREFP